MYSILESFAVEDFKPAADNYPKANVCVDSKTNDHDK